MFIRFFILIDINWRCFGRIQDSDTGNHHFDFAGIHIGVDHPLRATELRRTLGKALGGASGGYTAARKEIVEWLRQRSRPYLFSNTLTPALAAAGALAQRYPDATFRYVGLGDKAESVMAPRAGMPLSRVRSQGFPRPGLGLIPFTWNLGLGILAALGIGGYVATSSIYTVSEVEQVIITQFGKPVGDPVVTPGLKFKTPFIQKVHRFEKRFLEWDGDPNQLPTRDKRFIWVNTYARWRISDPLLYFQRLRDERGAQTRLDDIIDGETRNAIANHDLVEVIRSTERLSVWVIAAISGR